MADALSYGPLKVVNYSYDGVRITYADFKKVAVAIGKGKVKVVVGQLPVGAGAMYIVSGEQGDTIIVPSSRYGSSVADKIGLAHEAVHCILDAKGVSISALWTEVCAYVTTGILEMYAAIPLGGHSDTLANELIRSAMPWIQRCRRSSNSRPRYSTIPITAQRFRTWISLGARTA